MVYFKGNLKYENTPLTRDAPVVCIFVNDNADRRVIEAMAQNGVKLIALRWRRL